MLNNAGLCDNLYRMNLIDSPNCPDCDCSRQTVSHVILECNKFSLERQLLVSKLPVGHSLDLSILAPRFSGMPKSQCTSHIDNICNMPFRPAK